MSKDKDNLLDHNYDGIRECDNQLPKWWLYIFYASMVYAVFYMVHYHFGEGESQVAIYEKQMAQEAFNRLQNPVVIKPFEESEFKGLVNNSNTIASAKAIYDLRCVSCHGVGGAGGIGPNLTDEYWLHGGKITSIANTISEGVIEKGMIAWKDILTRDEVIKLAVYIHSLIGTHPAQPKAPQGEKETL